jgi:hypothetical protein
MSFSSFSLDELFHVAAMATGRPVVALALHLWMLFCVGHDGSSCAG